jgi:hypothetical protein
MNGLASFYADRIHTCTLRCTYSQFLNSKCLRKYLSSQLLFVCTGFCTFSKCQESVKATPLSVVSEHNISSCSICE